MSYDIQRSLGDEIAQLLLGAGFRFLCRLYTLIVNVMAIPWMIFLIGFGDTVVPVILVRTERGMIKNQLLYDIYLSQVSIKFAYDCIVYKRVTIITLRYNTLHF